MERSRGDRFWQSAGRVLLGGAVLAVATAVGYRMRADPASMAIVYVFIVLLQSLWGDLVAALVVAALSVAALDFFFTEPRFGVTIGHPIDVIALIAFAGIAVVVAHLSSTVRKSFETLRRRENVLREQAGLLDLTHDTIFVRDMNDVVTYWNRGAEELYGWTRDEAIGQVTHTINRTIFPAPLEEITSQLLRTGRWEGELVHSKRDGSQVTVASRWSLLKGADGLPVSILETNNDITSRRQAEDAARRAQAELAHASRVATMGELAASIAHEVNQPLSGVVINANACLRWLAAATPNLGEARDALERIIRDGKRASEVVARVRALSKKTAPEIEHLDMNDIIRGVVALTQGELRKSGVALRTRLATDLESVQGDRVQLQQVVLNLIMNGIDAMSGVSDRPRELLISTTKDADRVLVAVRDSGMGLEAGSLDHIFDAFYTTKEGGLGMGLSISRSIVESHGGRLWAKPNEGPGATFHFTV